MRQHFHRRPNLRLVTVDARELGKTRARGHIVIDELCTAKKLSPCVGLVECDVLGPGTAAADWGGAQPARATEGFAGAGIAPRLDESLRALGSARLDAIDRALSALARGDRFDCLRCGRPIAPERLREGPDTRVCEACAGEALSEPGE